MVMNDGREGGRVQGLVSIEVRIVAKPNPQNRASRERVVVSARRYRFRMFI